MSLIHLRPATLNPKVHYISPFFHPVAAELAAMERALPAAVAKTLTTKASDERPVDVARSRAALLAHDRRRLKIPPSRAVRHLCLRLNLRLQCGEVLHALYRAKGTPLTPSDLRVSGGSASTAICQIRRALPDGCEIRTTPGLGWAMPTEARAPIIAMLAEHGGE